MGLINKSSIKTVCITKYHTQSTPFQNLKIHQSINNKIL